MTDSPAAYIVDDDASMRALIGATLQSVGIEPVFFASADEFATFKIPDRPACILLDLQMPGQSGLELLERHFESTASCPVIVVTAHASVQVAVKSMKLGAVDFLEKPIDRPALLAKVQAAIEKDRQRRAASVETQEITRRLNTLSPREKELLWTVIEGKSTKMIADQLGISARTVDHHRANLMQKMQAANVADLVRMAVAANFKPPRV
ncbi:MAG TPA: response regulator [Phycisphaerae bacterium]|nr:response regulator [Phycisphaerae bacterium]